MTWLELCAAALCTALLLFLPGGLLLSGLRVRPLNAVLYAPMVSLFAYCVLAIIYGAAGVPASCASLVAPFLGIAALCLLASALLKRRRDHATQSRQGSNRDKQRRATDALHVGLWATFCVVSTVVAVRFFIIPLDGPTSFVQDSDNTFHLSLIQAFVESGNYSSLHATLYPDAQAITLPLVDTAASFYPAAWHCLCAMVVSALNVSIPVAVNAVNFVLLALVFPTSAFALLTTVFRGERTPLVCGALLCLAFTAFPWGALYPAAGPLYANFIGFCMLPALCALFIKLVDNHYTPQQYAAMLLMLLAGAIACTLAHPNVIFSAAVLLYPFCLSRLGRACAQRWNRWHALLAGAVFTFAVAALWYVAYRLPPLQSIVQFDWDPFTDIPGALVACLSLSLRIEDFPQWGLGLLVIVGAFTQLRQPGRRWLVASWLLSCALFVVCGATDGELEHLLTGFWYTDPYRIAILVALSALQLAVAGATAVVRALIRGIAALRKGAGIGMVGSACACLLALVPTGLMLYRSVNEAWNDQTTTPFGNIEFCLMAGNDVKRNNTLDPAERAFLHKVAEVVDPSYQIYNCADDGSPFGYPLEGLNLCYRRSAAETLETEPSYAGLLRTHINELASNTHVQEVLKEANIKYILVLDLGGQNTPYRCYYGYYWRQKWLGINSIDGTTPGLKCLLSEGDRRLYEIV
ncbi:DUF6541 family protein [Enorma phocaeensis]|uniref:DUF6541 family protein n=1 Tax=Enorma phocaeensis TaxID=1871019 RepID=UPI00195F1FDA|nr:DUF6541 family protein [Enorma phocaeensis]MBM6952118.1 hypothetical protein [Enorma phocaeensis]